MCAIHINHSCSPLSYFLMSERTWQSSMKKMWWFNCDCVKNGSFVWWKISREFTLPIKCTRYPIWIESTTKVCLMNCINVMKLGTTWHNLRLICSWLHHHNLIMTFEWFFFVSPPSLPPPPLPEGSMHGHVSGGILHTDCAGGMATYYMVWHVAMSLCILMPTALACLVGLAEGIKTWFIFNREDERLTWPSL